MWTRGRPNDRDVIHFNWPLRGHEAEPLCRNGSYHLNLTEVAKEVTCSACQDKLYRMNFIQKRASTRGRKE